MFSHINQVILKSNKNKRVWGIEVNNIFLGPRIYDYLNGGDKFKLEVSLGAQMVKNKRYACNAGDLGLIPGLGRSSEKEMAAHSSSLACRSPWTEGPDGLQSMGSHGDGHD